MTAVLSMPVDRECWSIDEMADQLGTTRAVVAFRVWALRQTGLGGQP